MSTPTPDPVSRVFDILEVLSDAVNRLSHEHESIRDDLREIRGLIAATGGAAAD